MMRYQSGIMKKNKVIVFDLDDTLIKEIDFLKSAYLKIANHLKGGEELYHRMFSDYEENRDVFDNLTKSYNISIDSLLNIYRNHQPDKLAISKEVLKMLSRFKERSTLGMITDGRSVTQRNKLLATGLSEFFDLIIISEEFGTEKPNNKNYEAFHKYKADTYYYIGDNIRKDFITPNKLGWITIGLLDSGDNIHQQDMTIPSEYHPKFFVKNILEIEDFI